MAEAIIKVDTDTMVKKAGEIQNQIREIQRNWDTIIRTISDSKSYWEGSASEKHSNMLEKEKTEVEEVIKRLSEHPTDLLQMAEIYVSGEEANEDMANELPIDIIS